MTVTDAAPQPIGHQDPHTPGAAGWRHPRRAVVHGYGWASCSGCWGRGRILEARDGVTTEHRCQWCGGDGRTLIATTTVTRRLA